jgi:hypothetical protein
MFDVGAKGLGSQVGVLRAVGAFHSIQQGGFEGQLCAMI